VFFKNPLFRGSSDKCGHSMLKHALRITDYYCPEVDVLPLLIIMLLLCYQHCHQAFIHSESVKYVSLNRPDRQ